MALAENAHRKLNEGEKYIPFVPDSRGFRQLSLYSIILGIIFAILFTGASAFLGVKIAQVPEASMSVALIAMAIALILKRRGAILENVMIQSIASVSTGIGAGALFVLPAAYILELETATFGQMFLASAIGGVLAILFTILVRKYYVVDQHGVYPFPEATVAAETLAAGESAGNEVKIMGIGLAFGAIVDLLNYYFGAWKCIFSTSFMPWLDKVAEKAKLVLTYDTSAAVVGMGYVVGLRFALIICGSCAVGYWIFVPIFAHLHEWLLPIIPQTLLAKGAVLKMSPDDIFLAYVRPIGIGTFFTAGLVSVILQGKTIISSIKESFGQINVAGGKVEENARDLSKNLIIGLSVLTIASLIVFFYFGLLNQEMLVTVIIIFVALVLLIAFMPAAIMATIMMGNAPVSGMTIVCLVFSCLVLAAAGFTGKEGMLVGVLFGTFMCTALAFSSSFITDLKIGYWIGSTPAKQEGMKIIATLISVVVVIFSMQIINDQYGFVKSAAHPNPMPAPQANAMAEVIRTFLGGGEAPWWFYGFGALVALIAKFKFNISPLAIALGFYIPLEYNVPLLVGAVIAHLVSKKETSKIFYSMGSKKSNEELDKHFEARAKERYNRGLMLATGLVAAGSIIGILSAVLNYFGLKMEKLYAPLANYDWSNWISLGVLIVMALFFYKISNKNEEK